MAVVQFSSKAQSLSVRLHAEGEGQAVYTCWLKPKGPPSPTPSEPFVNAPGDPEKTVTLPGDAASHDGEPLSVKVSYGGTPGDAMHLYFDILENPGGRRIGGFGDTNKPGYDVTIKGSEAEDYYDRHYLLQKEV